MTGGLAFEGLNNTSMDQNNLLIVLNDNHMAIDPLKGGITQYLVDLTTSATYNKWRWRLYQIAEKLHLVERFLKIQADVTQIRELAAGDSFGRQQAAEVTQICDRILKEL